MMLLVQNTLQLSVADTQYGDSAGNTAKEISSIFCRCFVTFTGFQSAIESKIQTGYDSLQVPARISADIPGWRPSGTLRHRHQETSSVRSHWDAICTRDTDHAGDEKFRGCWPSHLEQFTGRSVNCNSLPSDVRSTFEGPPVWLIGSATEDYKWRALEIHSSSSSSLYITLHRNYLKSPMVKNC